MLLMAPVKMLTLLEGVSWARVTMLWKFSIQQRIMHFLGQKIDKQNRFNVEICLLLEAGSSVSDERATTSNLRNNMMMNRYVDLVRTFEVENFVDPAIQEDMALRLYNAKKTMSGLHL